MSNLGPEVSCVAWLLGIYFMLPAAGAAQTIDVSGRYECATRKSAKDCAAPRRR